jgi:hypothetical protein
MSKKVHVQSFKTSLWGPNHQGAWYIEKNYNTFWANLYSMQTFLNSAIYKSSSVKVIKAPTKRALQKPLYYSSVGIMRRVHNLVCLYPMISGFPRKNYIGKYFPIRVKRAKRSSSFSSKARSSVHKSHAYHRSACNKSKTY